MLQKGKSEFYCGNFRRLPSYNQRLPRIWNPYYVSFIQTT